MNHIYILLRLDTSPNPLNNDSNIDRYEARAFLSEAGARAVMEAEHAELSHDSDQCSYRIDNEALIVTDEGVAHLWKIQRVEVAP